MNRITRMAGLTVGFVEPTGSIGRRNTTHQPMTTLALHRHRTIGGDRLPHRTPQAFGRRSRMALITGRAVGGGIQRQAGRGVGDIGVSTVDGCGQRFNPGQSAPRQRLAEMAAGTENRRAAGRCNCQTCGIVPVRSKRRGIQRIPELKIIVPPENVLPEIQNRIRIVHPPGRRPSCRTARRRMTRPAIHLV